MNLKRTSLTASIALMFAAAALPAHAQTTKKAQAQMAKDFEEMRAEIKRLREELDAMKREKAAAPAPVVAAPVEKGPSKVELAERIEQVELRAKDAVVVGDIGNSFRLPNSETSLRIYGFGELNLVHEMKGDNSNNDYSTFLPYAPLKGSAAANRSGQTYLHARTSRIGFEAATPTKFGALGIKIEGDFNNDPRTGNAAVSGDVKNIFTQQATNSYNFRLRHAYGKFGGLLIGQSWSTFMDLDALPETVDFNGPIGATFIRQPQIRYTYPTKDNGSFTFAVENPVSYVLDVSNLDGADDPDSTYGLPTVKGFSRVPDFIARWDKSFDWGTFSLRGLMTEHRIDNGRNVSVSRTGWGLGASAFYKLDGSDFLTVALTGGTGIGRYFNYVEGAVYDATQNKIHIEKALGAVIGYQHKASDTLRFNASLGWQRNYDNAYTSFVKDSDLDSGQYGVNRRVWQSHLGFIWNPVPGVDFGAEYIFGRRKTLANETGEMSRINFSAKYNFN
ncbi:MAG TPA: DcaP family trimeric outer membrane transporter [Paucimonas sp.]|nr:DcaP family trimeric outer membrane transporter [Paucimonas sp.]